MSILNAVVMLFVRKNQVGDFDSSLFAQMYSHETATGKNAYSLEEL